jgi:hypothetical protein
VSTSDQASVGVSAGVIGVVVFVVIAVIGDVVLRRFGVEALIVSGR